MKKINVRFSRENDKSDIDVIFCASEEDRQVSSLMDRVRDPLAGHITVHDHNGSSVTLNDMTVISISTENKKLKVITEDGEYELRKTLRDVEKNLDPARFLKISRYEIINLGKVRKFDFSVSGSFRIIMQNGLETWASRRLIPDIRKRLEGKE